MAEETVTHRKKGLKVRTYGPGLVEASRKTKWLLSHKDKESVDDLSFTSRDKVGRLNWWDVQAPKTTYWPVHHMLGRAYAFEVLSLLNNPDANCDNKCAIGFISTAIAKWLPSVAGTAATGIADGFFGAIGEYVATGTANR